MYWQSKEFIIFVKRELGHQFKDKIVLDIGIDVEIVGGCYFLYENCNYTLTDISMNPLIFYHAYSPTYTTVNGPIYDLSFSDSYFDTISSTEFLKNDVGLPSTLSKIYSSLKPGGLLFFTCNSSIGEPESSENKLTLDILNNILNLDESFSSWNAYFNSEISDMFFIGIKSGGDCYSLPQYENNFVTLIGSK